MAKILIIDDRTTPADPLCLHLNEAGHQVTCTEDLAEGLQKAGLGLFEVVYLNPKMPHGQGIDALAKIVEKRSHPEVIILTEAANPDEAEQAIQHGAWDYVVRSSDVKTLLFPLLRALQYRSKKAPGSSLETLKRETFTEIIGNSPRMKRCLELMAQAAQSGANVVITGETGTGKELFAWAIHNNSTRAEKNFVVVDCASLPPTLVESTLFGHEKGAYTGAEKAQIGLIKQADGGTLFLDEVSELPLAVQSSFLRVLQERRFRPVGGTQEVDSDFRLIAATNKNPAEMAKKGEFRGDLLFRLQTLVIELPPLRQRPEDIKYLSLYHLAEICDRYGLAMKEFSGEFLDILNRYPWPGNVRELVNAIEKSVVSARHEPVLYPKHLPTDIRIQVARASAGEPSPAETPSEGSRRTPDLLPSLKDFRTQAVAELEQKYLKDLLGRVKGDIHEAVGISGLSRSRLYGLLKKYRIPAS
jgi:two-component system NtrC family response regulator